MAGDVMGLITRFECPDCGRVRTERDGVVCRGVMTVAEHPRRGWKAVEYVRADLHRGAVERERALAEAIISLADSAGMPESFRETDSRMVLARETLARVGGQ